jgi:hypothetical protein
MVGMLHDNTALPLVEAAGLYFAPGRKHKLGFRKKAVTMLPSPYTTCTEEIPLALHLLFDQYDGADYAYSQDLCDLLCIQAYT